jgi:hypothetical protein
MAFGAIPKLLPAFAASAYLIEPCFVFPVFTNPIKSTANIKFEVVLIA